jgi:hypothetical protein
MVEMVKKMKAYTVEYPPDNIGVVMHATDMGKARYWGAHELDPIFFQDWFELKVKRRADLDADGTSCPACGAVMHVYRDGKVMFCRQCYGSGPEEEWEDW